MPPLSRGALCARRRLTHHSLRRGIRTSVTTGRERFFRVSEEVQDALATGKPVVALETTIYTHGYPYSENVALSSKLESLVRINGGVPATIGVINGVAHVGMQPEELIQLVSTAGSKETWKLSRRDLGFIAGLGLRGQRLNGGTTIAGTMILAHLAGIKIFATGGLGGVHRGGENSMDISADLTELGRTPVAVISSGSKSFLDIGRTLEYLETQGVGVGTFADGRQGDVDYPGFWTRESGFKSPQTIQAEADAAAIVYAQSQFPIHSGLLFANPVPEDAAIAKGEMDKVISQAVLEAEQQGVSGNANTPFILKRIREITNGASVTANTALVEANVARGTKVAVELAKLERRGGIAPERTAHQPSLVKSAEVLISQTSPSKQEHTLPESAEVDLLVAGAIANDTICDHIATASGTSPVLQTSNLAIISQSAGGVGRNVALAAHYAGAQVALASVVADDIAGSSLLEQVKADGIVTTHVRTLKNAERARTAQYVAVNDGKKDLVLAMADMSILEHHSLESASYWAHTIEAARPKWLVVDGNWSPAIMKNIFAAAKKYHVPTAFEPVSTAKAVRLFDNIHPSIGKTNSIPEHILNFASPNALELTAMYTAAREAGYFETEGWWETIDDFGLSSSGSRDRFTAMTSSKLVEQGIPQQALQLLPYIPNLVIKLGPQGCLLAQLLKPGDSRLRNPDSAPCILSRNLEDDAVVGGVYMCLFPPSRPVADEEVISVNGIGDTMLGVIMAQLVKGRSLEEAVPVGQEAAVLSLKSAEAVAPAIRQLRWTDD